MMIHMKVRLIFRPHLRDFSVSVFHFMVFLLLMNSCRGQSQTIGSSQPIVAMVGDDVILPCYLEPAVDARDLTVEWARPDLNPTVVHLIRDGVELLDGKNPSYKERTSLSTNKLKRGDVSLKLSKVKLSDAGTYRCLVPTSDTERVVELDVGSVSSPELKISKDGVGVLFQCESKGWYPKPEVLWLDAEGKLLSAGPAEPIRGPDGLYTVSSRVTVEKKLSKSFTCRVQQKNINQTRETTFYVSDDFIILLSSSSALTAGFAVSLSLCILLILCLVFFLWRRKKYKNEKTHQLEEGREREQLMSAETEKVRQQLQEEQQTRKEAENKHKGEIQKNIKMLQTLNEELEQKKQEFSQKLQAEQQRRKKAEDKVKNLEDHLETKNKELETKNKEVKGQQAKVQRLIEEKQRNMKELQTLNEELKQKNKEVRQQLQEEQQRRKNLEDQLETKNKELETKNKELKGEIEEKEKKLQTLNDELEKIKEMDELNVGLQKVREEKQKLENEKTMLTKDRFGYTDSSYHSPPSNETWITCKAVRAGEQQAEVQQLSEEMQEKEKELQTLKEELKQKKKELEKIRTRRNLSPSTIKLKEENLQRLFAEIQKKEEELQTLNEELEQKIKELEEMQKKGTSSDHEDPSTPRNHTDAN